MYSLPASSTAHTWYSTSPWYTFSPEPQNTDTPFSNIIQSTYTNDRFRSSFAFTRPCPNYVGLAGWMCCFYQLWRMECLIARCSMFDGRAFSMVITGVRKYRFVDCPRFKCSLRYSLNNKLLNEACLSIDWWIGHLLARSSKGLANRYVWLTGLYWDDWL